MFAIRFVLPLALVAGAFCSVSSAQSSMPTYTTTYCVQVKFEFWRNGATYWSTEYETSDLQEAQLIHAFFESAFENGTLGEILGSGLDWIVTDVRLKTKYEWNLLPSPIWESQIRRY